MKLVHWYDEPDNIDTIKSIIEEDDPNHYWLDCGKLGRLSDECCMDFTPQVGDTVELFIDEDNEIPGWILRKVTEKSNEDYTRSNLSNQ